MKRNVMMEEGQRAEVVPTLIWRRQASASSSQYDTVLRKIGVLGNMGSLTGVRAKLEETSISNKVA
ncbi:hypothetical protein E2C01_005440 [Portunus trituberculatus]|uniref:Uncharacterized protein n=1 Tax=Portunus trituberculatus TaxID=210409 RepID=A0A5B7CU83_PORTR|nr:hypothetical protein [Portunus trituberculatus]